MSETNKGYLYLLIGGALWGCAGVFLTLLGDQGLTSIQVAFFNLGSAALFLFVHAVIKHGIGSLRLSRNALLRLIFTGFVSEFLYDIFYINSVEMIGVGPAAVLLYTSPMFSCILASVCFKENITMQKAAAIILNVIGCALAATGGRLEMKTLSTVGVVFGILSGLLYAGITILGKYNTRDLHPDTITFYNFFFGFVFMLFLARPWNFAPGTVTTKVIILGLCTGIIGAAIPYLFYMQGMKRPVEASKAPVFASLEPVVAMVLGALIFKESVTVVSFLGVIIIIVSIFIINRKDPDD